MSLNTLAQSWGGGRATPRVESQDGLKKFKHTHPNNTVVRTIFYFLYKIRMGTNKLECLFPNGLSI